MTMKICAVSRERWRATAAEKRAYGGSTVTEFWVYPCAEKDNPTAVKIVVGYGRTPSDRKADAIRRYQNK